jgi:multiple sugar transport system substrate-binding protein
MSFATTRRGALLSMVAGAAIMLALPALAEDVAITFWGAYGNGGNSTQQDALNATLIPAFEAAHPGIKVQYVDVPYDSLLQKLTTSAAGGELPDLVRADLGWVPQFAKLGVLVPLSEAMPDFNDLADKTYPGVLATNLYKGKYYGLPLDTNTRVLVTSQAALDAAGLSAPPATFDELKAAAPKLKDAGFSVFADGGLGAWNIMPWIWSGGGDITNAELTKASGVLDSAQNVATVQMLVDLYNVGQIPNLIIGNQGATGTSDGLPSAEYANIFDGPWMAGIWKDQYPDFTPIYATIPAGPGGSVSVVGGEDIVVTASSKNQEAALEFVRFTQSEQFQMEMVKTGQMTVLPAYAEQQNGIAPFYATFAEQLKTAKNRLPISQAGKVDGILNTELTAAFKGEVSVQDALTKAAGQVDELLAQENS